MTTGGDPSPAPTRRQRQLAQIALLVDRGDRARAAGLALEHIAEFPGDADRLARVAPG
jgi:hypothetical protein